MPNQLNYPDQLPPELVNTRPTRLSSRDINLFDGGLKEALVGTDSRDVVEVWLYYPDGLLAGGISLAVTDSALKLSTVIDNNGPYEFLDIDVGDIVRRLELQQGRYAIAVNIFRNEVGSENSNKLYIETISSDRTELRLYPSTLSTDILTELYEFVEPSVPKIIAQGLTAEVFGQVINGNDTEKITPFKVKSQLDLFIDDTSARIAYANVDSNFSEIVDTLIHRAYSETLDNMNADIHNKNIQAYDLESYIISAVETILLKMKQNNEIDHRFEAT